MSSQRRWSAAPFSRESCGWTSSLAFSADGARLATAGDDGVVRTWAVPSGRLLSARAAPCGGWGLDRVGWRGATLLVGDDEKTWVIRPGSRARRSPTRVAEVGPPPVPEDRPTSLGADNLDAAAVAADGTAVVVSSWRAWLRRPGCAWAPIDLGGGSVRTVAFAPDGRTFALGGDGLWLVDVGAVVASTPLARVAAGRSVVFGGDPPPGDGYLGPCPPPSPS